jgi:peptidoglycan glycosyltransferase
VTLTEALGSKVATEGTLYEGPGSMDIGGAPVTNYGGYSYGTVTVETATMKSINTVFGQLATDIGSAGLVERAESFGFNSIPPFELPTVASLMPDPTEMTEWETAWAGIGQPVGEHESPPGPQVTPLQMALVAAGIANDGVVMQPYVVSAVTDRSGLILSETAPRQWNRAMDAALADRVTAIMVKVVNAGTGMAARIPGVAVAGKTGTAEVGKGIKEHAWFIAFAPAEDPRVALAIVLENSGVGGAVSAPAAKPVLELALELTE